MKKTYSFKAKLIGLNLFVSLALGATSWGILRYIVHNSERESLERMESFAGILGDSLGAQFYERYGDVQALAVNPNIRSSNHSTIVETLNTYAVMYGIYDLIMVVDSHGKLVAVNDKAPNGKEISVKSLYEKNYSGEGWFTNTLAGKFTDDKEKNYAGTYFESIQSDALILETYNKKSLSTSFSAQLKDASGKVIGVISNRTNEDWFGGAVKQAYASIKQAGSEESGISILDKSGTMLFNYEPYFKKGDEADHQDLDLVFKKTVFEINSLPKNSLTRPMESGFASDNVKKIDVAYGFARVSGKKFIDSLGWSVFVSDNVVDLFEKLNYAKNVFYIFFFGLFAVSLIISIRFSSAFAKALTAVSDLLNKGAVEVEKASFDISTSSTELSEASTQQASAIQETAASIDQVSAMVKKNSENASLSMKSSNSSKTMAQSGQAQMQDMVGAINEISDSNTKIMNQVEHGNQQISEIVKVISEIGNKTKVINDIVFQTKLLSFNASVEAARAGEHGKGFAVVAEEVGNLAQMSGNAAKEISAMLDSSILKVEQIVTETKSGVEVLIAEGKSKVESGKNIAEKCRESLGKILESVQEVDSMVIEITDASKEQAQGVSEINKAINLLDQATHKNSQVAQKTASSSVELSAQSTQLKEVVVNLVALINGSDQKNFASVVKHSQTKNPVRSASSNSGAKVISISNAPSEKSEKTVAAKKVVGSNAIPSATDPRFEEI